MNYFNYFTEIEDAFVRRRGKHLFLSPLDWALMETWKQQGIPLHIVLRGIERAFDSYEAKPRKRSVKTLLYCQEEVEAQYLEWVESRVGANPASESKTPLEEAASSERHFSSAAVSDHLHHSRQALEELKTRNKSGADQLTETLSRASLLLEDIASDFEHDKDVNTKKLEDSLTSLDRMLSDTLLTIVPRDVLETINRELKKQFKPYKSHMEPAVYERTLQNLLLKNLREQYGVPRLSLFYL